MSLVDIIPAVNDLSEQLKRLLRDVDPYVAAVALEMVSTEYDNSHNIDHVHVTKLVEAVELEHDLVKERRRPHYHEVTDAKVASEFLHATDRVTAQVHGEHVQRAAADIVQLVARLGVADEQTLWTPEEVENMKTLRREHPSAYEDMMKTAAKVSALTNGLNNIKTRT